MWDVELWLKKDYAATAKMIQDDRAHLLKNVNHRWKCEGYLIRSLVRLKKTDEAIREAELISQRKDGRAALLALALASTGDVPRVLAYFDAKKGQRFFVDDCYFDEDLGPILRGAAFKAVQERYPPPPMRPPTEDRFDDDWD